MFKATSKEQLGALPRVQKIRGYRGLTISDKDAVLPLKSRLLPPGACSPPKAICTNIVTLHSRTKTVHRQDDPTSCNYCYSLRLSHYPRRLCRHVHPAQAATGMRASGKDNVRTAVCQRLIYSASQVPSDDEAEAEHRPRQRRNRDDDSDEEAAGGSMDVDAAEGSDVQMAKKLVRYALSCEYSRMVLRRDGIKDKGS